MWKKTKVETGMKNVMEIIEIKKLLSRAGKLLGENVTDRWKSSQNGGREERLRKDLIRDEEIK